MLPLLPTWYKDRANYVSSPSLYRPSSSTEGDGPGGVPSSTKYPCVLDQLGRGSPPASGPTSNLAELEILSQDLDHYKAPYPLLPCPPKCCKPTTN